ncbi:MAG TPA: ABC transporter ATP-binding protein [Firmicutes bacterium]|nr:ABC transporter ATP-binding protein [Bacillota bacterium]
MLKIENLKAGYGKREVLHGINLEIKGNFTYLLVGPNGAGKSTLLKTIAGFLRPEEGKIYFKGEDITFLSPAERSKRKIGYFFQGGEVFRNLTVKENLEIAGLSMERKELLSRIEVIYGLFPKLKKLENRRAGLLSGGERHQLALGMIFLKKPEFILLDEPSAGLAPSVVKEVLLAIKKMKEMDSVTILLVEQNISEGLKISDFVYPMKTGQIISSAVPVKEFKLDMMEEIFFK